MQLILSYDAVARFGYLVPYPREVAERLRNDDPLVSSDTPRRRGRSGYSSRSALTQDTPAAVAGVLENDSIAGYQVNLEITYVLDDPA